MSQVVVVGWADYPSFQDSSSSFDSDLGRLPLSSFPLLVVSADLLLCPVALVLLLPLGARDQGPHEPLAHRGAHLGEGPHDHA